MKHIRSRLAWLAIGVSLCLCLAGTNAEAQSLKDSLFRDADSAMELARAARADVLAPKNYGEAEKHYRRAEERLEKGENIDEIRRDLVKVVDYLNQAVQATKLAEVTFTSTIQARSDALKADAAQYAPELWTKAQAKFADAGRKLEDGDVNDAKKKGSEAQALYREAELDAIKTNFLDETRSLLERAEREKVKKYAPATLARATDLLSQAEVALERNRYDSDIPRNLARRAKYEAKHALYLAEKIREMDEQDMTVEDMLLDSEVPLTRLAAEIDVVAEFDQGYEPPTQALLSHLQSTTDDLDQMRQDLSDRGRRIRELEDQIAELDTRLGGASAERMAMEQRMQAEAQVRERFSRLEATFDRQEARVLREGTDVMIRLVGLNFDVGKAVIQPQYFGLLTKVQNAIRLFPEGSIKVAGHTDSHGTDELNLALSRERAEAVRQYILANMGLDPSQVTAVGYGESRPIANNETQEGRTRNRRIDIVIVPNLDAMGI